MFGQGGFQKMGSQFVACIYFRLSPLSNYTEMKVPYYVLREDPMASFAATNHPRIKCENIHLNNLFESILNENVYDIES